MRDKVMAMSIDCERYGVINRDVNPAKLD